MKMLKYLGIVAAIAMVAGVGASARGHYYTYRQYYSGWYQYPKYNYYYRYYYYKPTPQYYGYKYHYTLYYPTRPKYYYYYNHYNKVYYGRCPLDYQKEGKPLYSWLAKQDQGPDLNAIPEEKFPVPDGQTTPPIPETTVATEKTDTVKTDADLPRMDLPPGEPPTGAVGLPISN
jgi:hypothetical protein